MDAVFRALADPARRRILDSLRHHDGQTLSDLCSGEAMSRQAVSKHLSLMERAGLVVSVKRGRERFYYLNPVPIQQLSDRWIGKFDRPKIQSLMDLKRRVEQGMSEHTYIYAIHLASTPEKVWAALTENAFWQQYWNGEWRIESDWREGSRLRFYTEDGKLFSEGTVVRSKPPFQLTYTWPNPPEEQGDDPAEELTWEIETVGPGTVKLTLTHRNLTRENHEGVSRGWPAILSSLKTLLETGNPLRFESK